MPSAGDIVNAIDVQIDGVQLGIIGSPVTTSSNGTITSSGTETRDAVLGNLVFVVAAAQASTRYRITLSGRGLFCSAPADRYTINFRDGGASTPTATSTLVGVNFNVTFTAAGSPGVAANTMSSTFVPGAGTHTIGVFVARISGTGTATPVGACEFYVEALG
jgi:hypothetical protein